MNIIIDTNAVNSDRLLSGAGIKKLAIQATTSGYKICFPEVVLSEMTKHFTSDLEQKVRAVSKNAKDILNLVGIDMLANNVTPAVRAEITRYPTMLKSRIHDLDGKIMKSPSAQISASHVPNKAVNRKKPFKNNGEGYADAVIWESVLAIAKLYSDSPPVNFPKVIFVSNNSRDYCEPNSEELHSELLNELAILNIDPSVVTITPTLESASNLLDVYTTTDEYREMETYHFLTTDRFEGSQLKERLEEAISNALVLKSLENEEIGLGPAMEDPTISSFDALYDYSDVEVEVYGKDETFVSMKVSVNCFVDVFIKKVNIIDLDDPKLTVYDSDWNDNYVAAQLEMEIPFALQFMTDDTLMEITGFEMEVEEVI